MISQSLQLCPAFHRREALEESSPEAEHAEGDEEDLSPSLRLTPPNLHSKLQPSNSPSPHQLPVSPSLRLHPLALRLRSSSSPSYKPDDGGDQQDAPVQRSQRLDPFSPLLEDSPRDERGETGSFACTQSLPLLPAFARRPQQLLLHSSSADGHAHAAGGPPTNNPNICSPGSTQVSPVRCGLLVESPVQADESDGVVILRKSDFLNSSPKQNSSQSSGESTIPPTQSPTPEKADAAPSRPQHRYETVESGARR